MSKTIITFGTFDGLHAGHVHILTEAKKFGTFLIVVVAQDHTVNLLKEHFPKFPLSQRISNIEKTGLANLVISGDMIVGQWLALSSYEPDLIVLGYDQHELKKALPGKWKQKVRVIEPIEPSIYKSSILNKKHDKNTGKSPQQLYKDLSEKRKMYNSRAIKKDEKVSIDNQ
jgi:cytidyltransferase-like protein